MNQLMEYQQAIFDAAPWCPWWIHVISGVAITALAGFAIFSEDK